MQYQSRARLLGLPLVHVATGTLEGGRYRRGVARGWIALGDVAFGLLFSAGGVAIGGISVGGAAVGLISLGGASLGALALGGLAVGVVAVGGGAFALWGAIGGLALAGEYALGGLAIAPHANDDAARAALGTAPLRLAQALLSQARWLLLLTLVPLLVAAARWARARGVVRPRPRR